MVAAAGVTFSTTMFIALLGFMKGLNDLLDGIVLNRVPHVRLFNEVRISPDYPIDNIVEFKSSYNFVHSLKPSNSLEEIYNGPVILDGIRQDERVVGAAPRVSTQVFFNAGPIEITGVVNGVDPDAESRLFNLDEYIIQGSVSDIGTVGNSIILGRALADNLLVSAGDVIHVTTPENENFPLKIVGFFTTGLTEFDKTQSYASLNTARKLLGKGNNYITEIHVKLKDIAWSPGVAGEYAAVFNTQTEDIQTAHAEFETGSSLRSLISYAVGITLLIVSGFGIYNILNMLIYEKMDTIAILKATGFSGLDVNRIFLFIALSIGVSGGCLGLLVGFLVSFAIDQVPFETPSVPSVTTYPVDYSLIYYTIAFVFSIVATYLAGLFPAMKASRIDPVDIIRGK